MFSKRTRIAGSIFCLLWVLFLTGQLDPLFRSVLEPAGAEVRATELQYLPWSGGTVVHVNNGNLGPVVHVSPTDRYGWDFGLPMGAEILLGIECVVHGVDGGCPIVDSWTCNDDYGNTVTVQVSDGTCARFAHLSTIAVSPGESLGVGALIGTVGSSGRSTDPHLHYHRENCATGLALPSGFVEAGVPRTGENVMSALPANH